jgi:hypothetical protein
VKRRLPLLLALALALGVVGVYLPAGDYGFFVMDDNDYTFENPVVQEGLRGIVPALTGKTESHRIPLTTLSYQAEVTLAGMNPRVFHRTNIALHALAMGGLLLLLWRLTGALFASAIGVALVALHPLRVESVVWITARKDVLSMALAVLTLAAWLAWVRTRRSRWYLFGAASLTLGLMAKPTLIVVPPLLLVLDFWPLGRFPRGGRWRPRLRALGPLLVEKLPLGALGAASAIVTYGAQAPSLRELPWGIRLERAVTAPLIYLRETLWPAPLTIRFDYAAVESHPAAFAQIGRAHV